MHEKIAKEASGFYLVGQELFERVKANKNDVGYVRSAEDMLAFPMIVNLALSCELFLKSELPESELGVGSGHNLKILYNKLDDSLKAEVRMSVVAECGADDEWFYNALDRTAKAFPDWRYYYETPQGTTLSASVSLLLGISMFFNEKCKEEFNLK